MLTCRVSPGRRIVLDRLRAATDNCGKPIHAHRNRRTTGMPDGVTPSRDSNCVLSTLDFFIGDPEPEELKDYSENHAANTL